MIDEDDQLETRVIVPDNDEIVIGPLAVDDCDSRGSQMRYRWPGGDGEGQYVDGFYPEHVVALRKTLIDMALAFYVMGWRNAGFGIGPEQIEEMRAKVAALLAEGVDVANV